MSASGRHTCQGCQWCASTWLEFHPVAHLKYRFKNVPFADVCLVDSLSHPGIGEHEWLCTAVTGVPGDPALGGAEDGRTIFYRLGFREGVKGDRVQRDGPKHVALDASFLPEPLRVLKTFS